LANIVSTVVIFYLVKTIPAFVIYPVIMAAPILAMLVIGNYVYKEKMNVFGWASCLAGTAGLVLLGLR
jgi:drug/metabolite transporter (DMT)-like permease